LIIINNKIKINYNLKLDIRGLIGNKLTGEKDEEYPTKRSFKSKKTKQNPF